MPRKWIIFRIANLIFLLCMLIIFSLMAVMINDSSIVEAALPVSIITIITAAVLLGFFIINYLWLERYFPDNYPSDAINRVSKIFFTLNIIFQSLLVIFFLIMLIAISNEEYTRTEFIGIVMVLSIYGLMTILGIYLLIYQYRLRKLVTHNHRLRFTDFLDNEG